MDESVDGFGQMEEKIFGENEEEFDEEEGEYDDELPGPSKLKIKRHRLDYYEIKRFTDENEFEQWIQRTDWTKY